MEGEARRARREQGRPLVDNPWLLPDEGYPGALVLATAIRMASGG